MSPKKIDKKKSIISGNIKSLFPKDLNVKKININPINVIEKTKNKLENYYSK